MGRKPPKKRLTPNQKEFQRELQLAKKRVSSAVSRAKKSGYNISKSSKEISIEAFAKIFPKGIPKRITKKSIKKLREITAKTIQPYKSKPSKKKELSDIQKKVQDLPTISELGMKALLDDFNAILKGERLSNVGTVDEFIVQFTTANPGMNEAGKSIIDYLVTTVQMFGADALGAMVFKGLYAEAIDRHSFAYAVQYAYKWIREFNSFLMDNAETLNFSKDEYEELTTKLSEIEDVLIVEDGSIEDDYIMHFDNDMRVESDIITRRVQRSTTNKSRKRNKKLKKGKV